MSRLQVALNDLCWCLQSFSSVVGPNGSGKSNVIDAMLFVFGKKAKQVCHLYLLSHVTAHAIKAQQQTSWVKT